MERRWARLAAEAHSSGALDFTKITRKDPRSILKELIVLDHIERRMMADFYTFESGRVQAMSMWRSAKHTHKALEGFGKAYRKDVIPWIQVYIDKAKDEKQKRKVDLTDSSQVESYYNAMVSSTRRPKKDIK